MFPKVTGALGDRVGKHRPLRVLKYDRPFPEGSCSHVRYHRDARRARWTAGGRG